MKRPAQIMKKKPMFCRDCSKTTPHVYVGKESACEGAGLARGIIAICTLGISETSLADHFWQCERCRRIKKV